MRSIWKGAVSFGLVSIPVRLYSATEERDVAFHQVRRSDGSRIKYRRVAAADGEEVEYADIAKGIETATGETVILTDADLAELPLPTAKVIDVLEFVPLDQVDPIYFARSYYLEPEKTGLKPYVLLRDALEASGRVALTKVALRSREQLAALRVRDGVLVMETMLWPDEVRAPEFPILAEPVELRKQELAMAASLIETLAGDFDPSQYSDAYREALQSVIDAKVAGREVVAPAAEAPTSGSVLDLVAALRASVARARGETPGADSGADSSGADSSDEDPVGDASEPAGGRPGAAPSQGDGGEATGPRRSAAQATGKSAATSSATSSARSAPKAASRSAGKAAGKAAGKTAVTAAGTSAEPAKAEAKAAAKPRRKSA